MLRTDSLATPRAKRAQHLILYLEGPQDRAILRAWAQRLQPALSRSLFHSSVILGGRRPARAVEHFTGAGGASAGLIGLCVLDRDDGREPLRAEAGAPGLEFFTWGRRHIESYLLVPAAIERTLRVPRGDRRIRRAIDAVLADAADEAAYGQIDAKRLFGPAGELPRRVGQAISAQRVAREIRGDELHADVHRLFERLRVASGLSSPLG